MQASGAASDDIGVSTADLAKLPSASGYSAAHEPGTPTPGAGPDEYYRYLFENENDAIHIHDLSGRILDVNPVACERLGYTRDELLQMNIKQLDNPENAALYDEKIVTFLKTGHVVLETCHRRKDGATIPVEVNARLIQFRGQPAALSVVRDITKRKQAEAEIKRQNEELAALTAQAEDRARQLAVITELVHIASSAAGLDEMFPVFANQARRIVAYDRLSVMLYDPLSRQFVVRLAQDDSPNGLKPGMRVSMDEGLVEFYRTSLQPIVCPMPGGHEQFPLATAVGDRMGVYSSISMPLMIHDRFLGIASISRRSGSLFRPIDGQALLPVARQLAIAIENSRLCEQIEVMAIRSERDRLGREMHDGLGQVLGYVTLRAAAASELLRAGKVEAASEMLDELTRAAQTAYAEVREAILGLRSSVRANMGLEATLREYLERYENEWGIGCDVQIEGAGGFHCEPRAEVQFLRIIQEALTNVRKHSGATRVVFSLACDGHRVAATISDNGHGFDPSLQRAGHFGLQTMRERADSAGGEFEIGSMPGVGTRVIVRIPCRNLGEQIR